MNMKKSTKPAYKSVGMWGSVSAIGTSLWWLVNIVQNVDPAVILAAKDFWAAAAILVSAIVAWYGRLKADKKIKGIF